MDDLLNSIRKIMAEGERTEGAAPPAKTPAAFRPERSAPLDEAVGRSLASALEQAARAAAVCTSTREAEADRIPPRRPSLRLWGGAAERMLEENRVVAPSEIVFASDSASGPQRGAARAPEAPHEGSVWSEAADASKHAINAQPAPHTADPAAEATTAGARKQPRERLLRAAPGADADERASADRPPAARPSSPPESATGDASPAWKPAPSLRPEAAKTPEAHPLTTPDDAAGWRTRSAGAVGGHAAAWRSRLGAGEDAEGWRSRLDAGEEQAAWRTPQAAEEPGVGVGSTLDQLSRTIISATPRTLEDLVREMMRPMLTEWLNANLAEIVERQVRQEIDRLSRRR